MNKSKVWTIVGGILILVVIILCFTISPKDDTKKSSSVKENSEQIMENAQKESLAVRENEKKDFLMVNLDKYFELLETESASLVLIGREGCQYCEIAEPILHKIAKDYDLDINYLSLDALSDEDFDKLTNSLGELGENFGTPLLLVVSDNKVVDNVDGMTDTYHYVKFLKKNDFIK